MKLKRSVGVVALLLTAWGVIAPAAASGQVNTWAGEGLTRMLESAMWRAGFMRGNIAFQLRDAGYDSDIYYGFYGAAVPDGTCGAAVPVQLLLSINKKSVLEIYDNPRYDFYLKTTPERAWNNTFRGRFHFVLNKLYVRVGGETANNRRRLSQELDVNIREKTDRLDGLALWQASRSMSMALLYDREKFDYGDAVYNGTSLAETLNRRVDSLEFVTFVQAEPRFRFFVDGQYGNYVFTGLTSQAKNTRSLALFGGFVSVLREESIRQVGRIDGYLRVGYMNFNVLDPTQPDGAGLVGDVDLSVGVFRLTDARFFYGKGYEFSIFEEATFYVEQNYGFGLTRLLSRRTSLAYDLTFGQSTYPRTAAGGEAFSGVLYRFATHRLSLSKTFSRYFRVSLTATLGRRVTAETGQVWNRYLLGVSLDYGTPPGPEAGPVGGLLRASPGFAR
jgi:hypothetical protein